VNRNEIIKNIFMARLDAYLRDTLQGGGTAVACLPSCSEGSGFRACFLFFFAGGFHYVICNKVTLLHFE
jgi:hypothetical protein